MVIRMLTRKPVLLLNSCFEPIRIISVRQALKMLTKGKVSVVLSTKRMIYKGVYQPSVIRLVEYKYIPVRMQVVTKKNIYLRDNHTCQYCSRKFHGSELTLDHVLPRSRGGRNTWENLVTACKKCNQAKDDRTPDEAGMKLLHRVIPATVHTARGMLRSVGMAVEEWAEYLFVDSGGDKRFVALEA
jgi:5-methylcytosine-specific restriction endonuclease McrA